METTLKDTLMKIKQGKQTWDSKISNHRTKDQPLCHFKERQITIIKGQISKKSINTISRFGNNVAHNLKNYFSMSSNTKSIRVTSNIGWILLQAIGKFKRINIKLVRISISMITYIHLEWKIENSWLESYFTERDYYKGHFAT